MKKFTLFLDLKQGLELIKAYEEAHQEIPSEITQSIKDSGIISMEIFRYENRLVMFMETKDDFSFEKKAHMDAKNPHVQAWENRMWKFQKMMPNAKNKEKWVLAKSIFELQ